jgi:NSS family neurotransmitter:Na+ symporter
MTFLMASIGFAVGLGNIWRFPYVVGENGGSAFVLVYLLFAFGIGVPLVMAEWTIGRRGSGAASASGSVREVARQSGASIAWGKVGSLAVLAVFMLMLFYTVIAGWTMDYLVRAASGAFQGINAERSKAMFDNLMANPLRLGFWHTVVVLLTVYINSRGLKGGIEKAVNILMPALFVSLLLMVGYASVIGDFGAAVDFLLTPDFSRLKADTMLMALGQAFFSIGIAMAVMITYGSYLDRQTSIPRNAFIVVGADTLVALLAGFAIFPLVFAHQF